MLREFERSPESGFLGADVYFGSSRDRLTDVQPEAAKSPLAG